MNVKTDKTDERLIAPFFESCGCYRYDDCLPGEFVDKEGEIFKARPDFYHEKTKTFIEFKAAPLNSKGSKRTASNALHRQSVFRRGPLKSIDQIHHGWNHSINKQAIVQNEIGANNFIIVFQDAISEEDMQRYLKKGIVAITVPALRNWLAARLLQQKGVNTFTFVFSGTGEENEPLFYCPSKEAYV